MNIRQLAASAVAFAAVMAAAFAAAPAAAAEKFPTRPIRWIVPYPPGGITDVATRIVTQELGKRFGQSIIVDNRPGANSILGLEIVSRAQPDGYTLGTAIAAHAANQTLYPKLPYDSVKSFEQVSLVGISPLILCAHNALPANNVKELIELARAKPGQLAFGSSGIGAAAHLTTEYLMLQTGIKLNHIPYKGTAPALQDLAGGQIAILFDTPSSMMPQVRAGRIKALGIASAQRSAAAPEVPTIAETGLPGFTGDTWVLMLAPAGAPRAVVERISAEIGQIIRTPEVRNRFVQLGIDPVGNTPAEARKFLVDEVAKWGKVIRAANVKVEQ